MESSSPQRQPLEQAQVTAWQAGLSGLALQSFSWSWCLVQRMPQVGRLGSFARKIRRAVFSLVEVLRSIVPRSGNVAEGARPACRAYRDRPCSASARSPTGTGGGAGLHRPRTCPPGTSRRGGERHDLPRMVRHQRLLRAVAVARRLPPGAVGRLSARAIGQTSSSPARDDVDRLDARREL